VIAFTNSYLGEMKTTILSKIEGLLIEENVFDSVRSSIMQLLIKEKIT